MFNKENMLELEQDLYRLLESRKRLVNELTKLDNKIAKLKGLLIHRFTASDIKVGNLYKLIDVNLEKPIHLEELKSVLPNNELILEGVVAKIDYEKTLKMLEIKGFKGIQAQSIVDAIKTLQSDYYKELELKGK